MKIHDISIPDIYSSSADFRFFLKWFELCLSRLQYDTENFMDLYDPLRCPSNLLWMLADTMGFKYDDRELPSFNRLVLLYFMSMIRNKGSKDGVTLAAEVNLAQFNLQKYAEEESILEDRLEDTSIPVNSVYVTPHVDAGYIDVVYFSNEIPTDACIEYVRPLGMYVFSTAGVRMDVRSKLSVDARLTSILDVGMSLGPTHVGHYRRDDYARMQRMQDTEQSDLRTFAENEYDVTPVAGQTKRDAYRALHPEFSYSDPRHSVYYRNKAYEVNPDPDINPGYRALYSLQLSNNEHVVKSLIPVNPLEPDGPVQEIDPIFSLGYGPQDVGVTYPDNYLKNSDEPNWNLRYDYTQDTSITNYNTDTHVYDISVIDVDRSPSVIEPRPAVNPIMTIMGSAIAMNDQNTRYTKEDSNGDIVVDDI